MKFRLAGAALALGLLAGAASAQTVLVPTVTSIGAGDLFNDQVNGQPGVGNHYATAAQIAGVPGYRNLGAATTGNTYTYATWYRSP